MEGGADERGEGREGGREGGRRKKGGFILVRENGWEGGKVKESEGKSNEGREGKYLVWRRSCMMVAVGKETTVKKEREGVNEEGRKLMIKVRRGDWGLRREKNYEKEEKGRKGIKNNRKRDMKEVRSEGGTEEGRKGIRKKDGTVKRSEGGGRARGERAGGLTAVNRTHTGFIKVETPP